MLSRLNFHSLKISAWQSAPMHTASSTLVQTSHIRNYNVGYLLLGRMSHQMFGGGAIDFVRVRVSHRYPDSATDENVGGDPVRGKFRKMMLRYELSPVFRPIQNGELAESARMCGTKYLATFIASIRKSR